MIIKMNWFNFTHPLKILDFDATIAEIKRGKSFSRFGDGEISWIHENCPKENAFQNNDHRLSQRLKAVLDNPVENLMIGLPHSFRHTRGHTEASKQFWKQYNLNYQKANYSLFDPRVTYGDAQISRWYILYQDKSPDAMEPKIRQLKSIWQDRDIVVIEGENSKIGVGNDLLANAKSLRRIIIPAKNAFNAYDEILQCALSVTPVPEMFLIAAGPTATVLAYDLAKAGCQAVDIGHVDVEYEWYLAGATTKQLILGKTVNEIAAGDFEGDISSPEYQKSIVGRVLQVTE